MEKQYRTIELGQLWDRILEGIKVDFDPKLFDSILNDSYLDKINGTKLIVVVNSSVAARVLKEKYLDFINSVVRSKTQSDYSVEFVEKSDVVETPVVEEKQTFFKNSYINPQLNFDNFVVGVCNREASQAALVVAANPGRTFNPLFIYSDSGLGKTHLLQAIGNYIKENNPNRRVLYLPAEDFFDEYVRFVKGDKESEDLVQYFKTSVDVLLIDDIQFFEKRTKTNEKFFTVFSNMIQSGKQVVIASDKSPNELRDMEQRLITRFSAGLTVNIKSLDFETSKQILRTKITMLGLDINNIDNEVIDFYASKFSRSVRNLEGALNRLIFISTMNNAGRITLDVAMEAVKDELDIETEKQTLSEQKIINVVADYYSLPVHQLTGKQRTNQVAMPRHIAMYLIRDLLDVSYTKIGQTFGGKDHSTVMSGVEKVEKQLKTDSSLQKAIEELKDRLK